MITVTGITLIQLQNYLDDLIIDHTITVINY